MGVITTADERLSSAKGHIGSAIQDLNHILIEECWGHDEFRKEYQEKIAEAFTELVGIGNRLRL